MHLLWNKKQLVEKTVVEHIGKVDVDGIVTASSKLVSAYQCLQAGNAEKANLLYREITELEPQNPYAWWGHFICEESFAKYYGFQDKYGNDGNITKANQILSILDEITMNIEELSDSDIESRIDNCRNLLK